MPKQTSQDVTLATINTLNVGDSLLTYQDNLSRLPELETKAEHIRSELMSILNANPFHGIEGNDWRVLANKLVVYKDSSSKYDKDIEYLTQEVGKEILSITTNTVVVRRLRKLFGKDVVNVLQEVANCYDDSKAPQEVDEAATKEARKKANELLKELIDIDKQIKVTTKTIDNFERYMNTLEKVSSTQAHFKENK